MVNYGLETEDGVLGVDVFPVLSETVLPPTGILADGNEVYYEGIHPYKTSGTMFAYNDDGYRYTLSENIAPFLRSDLGADMMYDIKLVHIRFRNKDSDGDTFKPDGDWKGIVFNGGVGGCCYILSYNTMTKEFALVEVSLINDEIDNYIKVNYFIPIDDFNKYGVDICLMPWKSGDSNWVRVAVRDGANYYKPHKNINTLLNIVNGKSTMEKYSDVFANFYKCSLFDDSDAYYQVDGWSPFYKADDLEGKLLQVQYVSGLSVRS